MANRTPYRLAHFPLDRRLTRASDVHRKRLRPRLPSSKTSRTNPGALALPGPNARRQSSKPRPISIHAPILPPGSRRLPLSQSISRAPALPGESGLRSVYRGTVRLKSGMPSWAAGSPLTVSFRLECWRATWHAQAGFTHRDVDFHCTEGLNRFAQVIRLSSGGDRHSFMGRSTSGVCRRSALVAENAKATSDRISAWRLAVPPWNGSTTPGCATAAATANRRLASLCNKAVARLQATTPPGRRPSSLIALATLAAPHFALGNAVESS